VSAGDAVVEQPGEGTDTVETSLKLYQLGDNIETLTFKDRIIGGLGSDYPCGNAGPDTFVVTSNAQLDAIRLRDRPHGQG
jgi:hypothetical protein